MNFGVENISGFKFWATLSLLERGQLLGSFLVYAIINLVLVGASAVIISWAPAAAGSGIAEVKVGLTKPAQAAAARAARRGQTQG